MVEIETRHLFPIGDRAGLEPVDLCDCLANGVRTVGLEGAIGNAEGLEKQMEMAFGTRLRGVALARCRQVENALRSILMYLACSKGRVMVFFEVSSAFLNQFGPDLRVRDGQLNHRDGGCEKTIRHYASKYYFSGRVEISYF